MAVTLEFFPDKRTLVFTIATPWTLDELMGSYPEAEKYFNDAPDKLTSIVDIENIGKIPPGALRARNSPFMDNPKSGMQIIIATQSFVRTMAEMSLRLANYKRVKFCNSMEEAWATVNGDSASA